MPIQTAVLNDKIWGESLFYWVNMLIKALASPKKKILLKKHNVLHCSRSVSLLDYWSHKHSKNLLDLIRSKAELQGQPGGGQEFGMVYSESIPLFDLPSFRASSTPHI